MYSLYSYICMYTGVKWDRITIISSISKGVETYSTDRPYCVFFKAMNYNVLIPITFIFIPIILLPLSVQSLHYNLYGNGTVTAYLSLRYCPCFPVPTLLSLLSYPYGTVPAFLYLHYCLCFLIPTLLSLLSYPYSTVPAFLSLRHCPCFLIPTALSLLSYPYGTVPAFLSLR